MKQRVYIVPRCYGQQYYLIPCAKSDGRVQRLTPHLVGRWVGSIATHRTPTLRNSSDRKRRKISQRAQVYNMHSSDAVHNQISEEINKNTYMYI